MKWLSTSPVAILTSASMKWRLMWISVPLRVLPMYVSIDSSSQMWSMIRNSAATRSPNIATFSCAVLGRWVPVPTRSVTFSLRTPQPWRIRRRGSRIPLSPLYGTGRVISEVVMHTVSSPASFPFASMIFARGGVPTGSSRERRISSAGWARGGNSCIPSVLTPGGRRTSIVRSPYSISTGFHWPMSAPWMMSAMSGLINSPLHPEVCLAHQVGLQQFLPEPLEDDPPRLKHVRPVGDVERLEDVLLDQENGEALLRDLADGLEDLRDQLRHDPQG